VNEFFLYNYVLCAICNQLVFLTDIRQQINNDKYHVLQPNYLSIQLIYSKSINLYSLLNIKGANLNQFHELNNILLFLIFTCVKMHYFNMHVG